MEGFAPLTNEHVIIGWVRADWPEAIKAGAERGRKESPGIGIGEDVLLGLSFQPESRLRPCQSHTLSSLPDQIPVIYTCSQG